MKKSSTIDFTQDLGKCCESAASRVLWQWSAKPKREQLRHVEGWNGHRSRPCLFSELVWRSETRVNRPGMTEAAMTTARLLTPL
jgi:hypothetical protein